jgi:hypothetical protein
MGYTTAVVGYIITDREVSVADLQQIRDVNWWCDDVTQEANKISWDTTEKRVHIENDLQKVLKILQAGEYKLHEIDICWDGDNSDDAGYVIMAEDSEVHVYRTKREYEFSEVLNY